MIIFDSGFLYAYINKEDPRHDLTLDVMQDALKGKHGRLIVSNYVIDEVLTLARARTGKCDCGNAILQFVRSERENKRIFLEIHIDDATTNIIEQHYEKYCEKGLSFTDCSLIALMHILDIDYLATLDNEFKVLISILP